MREWFLSHRYVLIAPIYAVLYVIGFILVEHSVKSDFTVIHTRIDDMIPFCEYFIVFYYLWFIYMAITIFFIVRGSRENFIKTAIFLMTGMTLFLIVSALFPNGHDLRPHVFKRNNVFVTLTEFIYSVDTPTNILPSIHVYNSIGCHIGFVKATKSMNRKWILPISLFTCILITVSTLFVKQHSVVDVISAVVLAVVMYFILR